MVSPSPDPPDVVSVVWVNRSKMRSASRGGTPGPSSSMVTIAASAVGSGADIDVRAVRGVAKGVGGEVE
jgi:hypothetical protein